MTDKHRDIAFRRNARIVRQQVAAVHRRGEDASCWRCGGAIPPGMLYDVGHINPSGGPGLDNLAPEHRGKSAMCQGNRSHGGRLGQRIQQARKRTTKGLLTW